MVRHIRRESPALCHLILLPRLRRSWSRSITISDHESEYDTQGGVPEAVMTAALDDLRTPTLE
jgi:hypothetical protein